jgi:hypothetical protein
MYTQLQLRLLFYIIHGFAKPDEKKIGISSQWWVTFLIVIFHLSIGKTAMNAQHHWKLRKENLISIG